MRINKGPTVHTSRTHDQIIKTSDKCVDRLIEILLHIQDKIKVAFFKITPNKLYIYFCIFIYSFSASVSHKLFILLYNNKKQKYRTKSYNKILNDNYLLFVQLQLHIIV